MAIEHDAITNAELHEPKGVSAASDNQIYLADGLGSGAWSDNIQNTHGDMVITGSSTATAVTAASDATLSTDSDYTKITAGWTLAHGEGITFNTDEIIVPTLGHYYLAFWATVKVPTTNNFIGVKYAVNDTTPYSSRKIIGQSQTANDYLNLSGVGIVTSLTANDTVSLYIAGSKSDNLIVQEAGLVCLLLHPGS